MIVLATGPALVAGFFFSKFVKSVLYGSFVVIALAFIVGGAIMLIVERFRPAPDVIDVDSLPVGRAFAIGSFQALALIPGVSRSGGTIVAAMAMRVDRPAAAEFTFFLAMPTMAAAFAHDLLEVRHNLGSARALEIAVGFVMAFIASALVVKPFLQYVRRSGFAPFAWYRIALGIVLLRPAAAEGAQGQEDEEREQSAHGYIRAINKSQLYSDAVGLPEMTANAVCQILSAGFSDAASPPPLPTTAAAMEPAVTKPPKLERCVQHLMDQGHSKESAFAICRWSGRASWSGWSRTATCSPLRSRSSRSASRSSAWSTCAVSRSAR
jgi:hypothetical protein